MAQLPRVVKNFSLFVDGRGLAGLIDTLTLPTLNLKEEDFRGGGMDAPVGLDMGMEKLEGSFVLAEFNETIVSLVGLTGLDKQLTARGALQRDGEAAVPMILNMTGRIRQMEPGDLKAGDMSNPTFSYTLTYLKITIAGVVTHEIDIINMKRIIGGVDQLQSIRTAIGV